MRYTCLYASPTVYSCPLAAWQCEAVMAHDHDLQVHADGSQVLEAMVLNMYLELIDGLFCQVCVFCLT